jgi:DNA-binding PadR family transcriptional regulator
LTPVSYVVLGLLARDGPSTPYDLKAAVKRGIAFFWPFPHSQLYSEPERLAEIGLVEEERENEGRRRRVYRITAEGRAALREWLATPSGELPQIRSLAFLKLFLARFARPEDIAALADVQRDAISRGLEEHSRVMERISGRPELEWQLAAGSGLAEMMRTYDDWWRRVGETARSRSTKSRPDRRSSA